MHGQERTNDSIDWLLEFNDPGVRYLAMREQKVISPESEEFTSAAKAAHKDGPIAIILDHMQPVGYWEKEGPGYYPKYRGSVWSLITLAQLGADVAYDERIRYACAYILEHSLNSAGQFSVYGTPSSTADCLQGNLCASLLALGFDDPRVESAFDWMARTVTGEGIAPASDRNATPRYYAGKCGPRFACGANNKLPCAWGGVKVMLAFSYLPAKRRTAVVQRAIERGADFLLSIDPATAAYPTGWSTKPSGNWWKFGFPVFYITDLLQLAEALVRLGYGADPRLTNLFTLIRDKQDTQGRWALEYNYSGKFWLDLGKKKQPNKWVTLRAMRVLKDASENPS